MAKLKVDPLSIQLKLIIMKTVTKYCLFWIIFKIVLFTFIRDRNWDFMKMIERQDLKQCRKLSIQLVNLNSNSDVWLAMKHSSKIDNSIFVSNAIVTVVSLFFWSLALIKDVLWLPYWVRAFLRGRRKLYISFPSNTIYLQHFLPLNIKQEFHVSLSLSTQMWKDLTLKSL